MNQPKVFTESRYQ